MSSKSADVDPRRPTRSWSIVARLTILYTASAAAILCAASAFLYWVLRENLRAEDRDTVADKIAVLRNILEERSDNLDALKEEVQWESTARKHSVYYARLLNEAGEVILESPGMKEALSSAAPFPSPSQPRDTLGKTVEYHSPSDRTFLLASAWSKTEAPPRRFLHEVALDVSKEKAILVDYREKLAAALLLGVLASAGAGIWIARRAMDPVREITLAAQRITANALKDRVSVRRWPRELAALAGEFDGMLQRLEDSFSRLSQFSADIAHELRTPINNLMGEAEVALSRGRSSEDYRRVLESSLEEYQRIARMIDSLLFMARADSAHLHIERKLFDAREVVESLCEFYEPLASESRVTLMITGRGSIYADVILFQRAVSNLIANALQHTSAGGRVTVVIERNSAQVEIGVTDTGCGISQEHLAKVFDRFYRVDAARASHPHGTGLGLAIVKTIMGLHQGSVTVQSRLGEGTRASLRFPQAPDRSVGTRFVAS
ncbi:MAG: heavy metal sensor histidine kinase [Verrucomicrobia bacterium]|nr:heavy metal sensor histidine kinase [Verrucomicrobiota bacterium]